MSYTPFYNGGWQSGENGGTPITPAALNHIDQGIINHETDKSNPHGVTPAQIGAAVDTDALVYRGNLNGSSNFDNAKAFGIYDINTWTGSGGTGVPPLKSVGKMLVYAKPSHFSDAEYHVIHELHVYDQPNCVLRRTYKDGTKTWTEWEWENPPMVLNTEYRTTERWQGKAVYTKLVDCGALPNAATKEVNLDFKPVYLISHDICYVRNNFYYSDLTDVLVYVASYGGNAMVRITTVGDNTEYHGYCTIRYTKD